MYVNLHRYCISVYTLWLAKHSQSGKKKSSKIICSQKKVIHGQKKNLTE